LSLYGSVDDQRAFLIIPLTENNPSTGTDDVLVVIYTHTKLTWQD